MISKNAKTLAKGAKLGVTYPAMEISINIVRHLLKKVEAAGYGELLSAAPGFAKLSDFQSGTMMDAETFLSIISYLNAHYPDAKFAYDIEYKYFHSGQLNMLGALGQLFQVSANLMEVSEAFFRYYSQYNKMFALSLEKRGSYMASKVEAAEDELWELRPFQVVVEMFTYGTIRMAREIFSDATLRPFAVTMPYEMPEEEETVFEDTVGLRPTPGEAFVVVWDEELFRRPLPFSNPELGQHLIAYLDQQVSEKEESIVYRLKQNIRFTLPELLDMENAATSVLLSPRTLQRKLKEQHTSYQQLLDEVRKELALKELEKGKLSLKEIGAKCGFKDSNSFFRAFKKWTGVTPGQSVVSKP